MNELFNAPPNYTVKPTVDLAFKLLMNHPSDKDHLLASSLLSAILDQPVHHLEFQDREITLPFYDAKSIRLDINASINNNLIVNVEMQFVNHIREIGNRSLYYASSLFVTQANQGSSYADIIPVRQIFLSHHDVFDTKEAVHEFLVHHQRLQFPLTEKMKIIIIELDKLAKQFKDVESANEIEKWAYYLERGHVREDRNIHELEKEEIFERAQEVLGVINNDQELRDIIFIRQKKAMDEAQMRYEGRKEGIQQGIEQNKLDVALTMLKKNYDDDAILEIVGISIQQLNELKNKR